MPTLQHPLHRFLRDCILLGVWLAAAAWAAPSTQLSLTGAITNPAVFTPASLQSLTATTQTVSFTAAGVPQTHTYTGTSLWGLVSGAGIVNNPAVNNDVLNKLVLATGTDGYKVVFSMGELHPSFGNRQDLVAHAETIGGVSAPLGSDGFARSTAPGDVRGGRYVSNLASLDVRGSGSTQAGSGGGASGALSVSGGIMANASFNLAALQALPPVTQVVGGVSYTGVSLWDLLNTTVGIAVNPAVNNDVLGKYVVATGSDGYKAVLSMGELNPNFGNQPDLVAYAADGVGLGNAGFARLVLPNDGAKGRWVANLVSLEILSASPVPEPASATLLVLGLAVLGQAARQRATAMH